MKQNRLSDPMSTKRTFALIGGELDGLKVDLVQPLGINLAEGGFFYLPSHLPDNSIIPADRMNPVPEGFQQVKPEDPASCHAPHSFR